MYDSIRPGQEWKDTDGKRIEAHGGYIHEEDGIYYWYGENKEKTFGDSKLWTYGIRYYSSTDLCNWKNEGFLIEPSNNRKDPMFYERRIDRPHIIRSRSTGKYVCWIKYNDTSSFSIWTADRFQGPYTCIKKEYRILGKKCGDFDLICDEEGQPYIFVETDHLDLISMKLTDDCTDVTGEPAYHYKGIRPPFTREGVACFRKDGKYYLLTSGMMGYVPNPSQIAVADQIEGPYVSLGDPHVDEPGVSSYNSQVSCIFEYKGKLIALADRWVPDYVVDKDVNDTLTRAIASNYDKKYKATFREKLQMMRSPMMGSANTSRANYVMLPIEFEDCKPVIRWKKEWRP